MPVEPDMEIQEKVANYIAAHHPVGHHEIEKATGVTKGSLASAITRLTYTMPLYEWEEKRRTYYGLLS